MAVTRRKRIGVVGYDGVQGLDIVGPLDAFSLANGLAGKRHPYELQVLGVGSGPVQTESGVALVPHIRIEESGPLDTVIVPGGAGLRIDAHTRATIALWLAQHAGRIRRVASICTGIYALAESGLLDGRRATTHWRYAGDVLARWPQIRLDANTIFVKDGRFYTSAGVTAGIDLSLALIEEDLGNAVALSVARELVVYLKRPGGQLQYSEPLQFQSRATTGFSEIVAWMVDHLAADLSVETLAERMHLSPRHFNRRFRATFGATPAHFVEGLRLDAARWRLSEGETLIGDLAASVGYHSDDAFRRAFERRFGVVPTEYRSRFSARDERANRTAK